MSNRVLIIVGDATETLDTMYPYYRLQEAGFTPVVAAPEKRLYQMVMHEIKPGWTITKEWEGYTIEAEVAFSQINPEEYAGILFSGGRAPEYIRYDEHLVRATKPGVKTTFTSKRVKINKRPHECVLDNVVHDAGAFDPVLNRGCQPSLISMDKLCVGSLIT